MIGRSSARKQGRALPRLNELAIQCRRRCDAAQRLGVEAAGLRLGRADTRAAAARALDDGLIDALAFPLALATATFAGRPCIGGHRAGQRGQRGANEATDNSPPGSERFQSFAGWGEGRYVHVYTSNCVVSPRV